MIKVITFEPCNIFEQIWNSEWPLQCLKKNSNVKNANFPFVTWLWSILSIKNWRFENCSALGYVYPTTLDIIVSVWLRTQIMSAWVLKKVHNLNLEWLRLKSNVPGALLMAWCISCCWSEHVFASLSSSSRKSPKTHTKKYMSYQFHIIIS